MAEKLEGIVSPSIDNLLNKEYEGAKLTKYELVIFASKRARQINEYYSALHEGSLFNNVGPLVETTIDEKPLTIAMHEIDEDKLTLNRH
jgi:DNA-directed RNA polymerase subunit omega